VLIAHTWGLLPLAAGYAMRINLLAAVTSAIAAGCWFLVSERGCGRGARAAAASPRCRGGALAAATAFTVWNQSVVNEKVYTLSLLFDRPGAVAHRALGHQPAGEGHDHHLLMIVFLLALTSTNHMMGVLVGPVVVVLLYPLLKDQRPADDAARRVEWSQWFVFCSVYALIVASGLENSGPLKLAAVLFLGALAYAFIQARNWEFAVAVLWSRSWRVGLPLLPLRAAHFPPSTKASRRRRGAVGRAHSPAVRQAAGVGAAGDVWAQLGMWFSISVGNGT